MLSLLSLKFQLIMEATSVTLYVLAVSILFIVQTGFTIRDSHTILQVQYNYKTFLLCSLQSLSIVNTQFFTTKPRSYTLWLSDLHLTFSINQGSGSAFVFYGSGSSCFSQCRSGSSSNFNEIQTYSFKNLFKKTPYKEIAVVEKQQK